jgi:hypothetical protein
MQLIIIISIQLLLMFLGILIAVATGMHRKFEIISISYLLGSGIFTIVFLLVHWFLGISLNTNNFFISAIVIFSFFFLLCLVSKTKIRILSEVLNISNYFKITQNNSKLENYIFYSIILLISYSFIENYSWPIIDWDALAFYDFRAKIMALNGNMIEGIRLGYFFQYPPYTSFLHLFGYIFATSRVKIIYTFIYSSFIFCFYSLTRRRQDNLISLFFTLLLATTPMIFEHSTMAYSNLSFTAFFSLGIIYLWYYFSEPSINDLLIGSILIGLSTWIRSTEPFWLVGLVLILISLFKHKKNFFVSTISMSWLALPDKLWRFFLKDLSKKTHLEITDISSHASSAITDFISFKTSFMTYLIRFFEVLKYLIFVLSPQFLLIFLLLLISFFISFNKKSVEAFTILMLFGIVFLGTYIFSFTFETWNLIGGSIIRMSMIFIPLLLFIISKDLKYEN